MKAPFPYFGGKSAIASAVWERLGNTPNYVEPFAGSLAVLLSRPSVPGTETCNDYCGLLANFWRAVKLDPDAVADAADWPVSEVDLHARHAVLLERRGDLTERLMADPDFYDAKLAGWWVWGACAWIGTGWCRGEGPWQRVETPDGLRLVKGDAGRGINRKLPHVGDAGRGINRQLPHLFAGRGINRQLPHVGNAGRGTRRDYIFQTMHDLSARLRNVRVACGDWQRVCGPSVTERHGMTAVFLDPPYGAGDERVYGAGGNGCDGVAQAAAAWAIANGDNPLLRICYAGYEGVVTFPDSWECVEWKSRGGFGSQGDGEGRANSHRERLWFSPACIKPVRDQLAMFCEPMSLNGVLAA